mgnify:CR=1 FL=1|jgi:hypothetical protein
MKFLLLISFLSIILFFGCRTNNLSKFDLNSKKMYFEEIVASGATNIRITYSSDRPPSKDDPGGIIKDIAKGIGTAFLSADIESKLIRAANPDTIIQAISFGVENALVKYLNVQPQYTLNNESEFVVTTILEKCELVSNPNGIYISVQAEVEITQRGTGELVWENTETNYSPIRQNYAYGTTSSSVSDVIQATQLATLSEPELRTIINSAAQDVGRKMANTLREDIREALKEKK